MDKTQESIIVGSLLGDGCLEKNSLNACFSEQHTVAQREYLEWKYQILKDLCASEVHIINRSFGKVYRLRTKKNEDWSELRRKWYPNGKKVVPDDLSLDELSLTVWYLDDGDKTTDNRAKWVEQKQSNTARISTAGFSYKENLLLMRVLVKTFDIQPKLQKEKRGDKKYYRLYFQSKQRSFDKLMAIVKDCFQKYNIPESMKYKLGERVETRQGRASILQKNLKQDSLGRFVRLKV